MRTKWGNQANPGRVPGKRQQNWGPKDVAEAFWLAVKLSSLPPNQHTHTLLCMTESCLGMRCVCVCMHARAFHLACHPTAASSPPPFCLVGVNEQQAPSNCLCLTQVNMCQWKKQMRRKQATKCDYRSCTFRSAVTRILADEGQVNFSSRVMWAQM